MVMGSLATVPPGTVLLVPSRRTRKLRARLEKYAHLSARTFLRLNILSVWVPGNNSVAGNVTMCFTTTMVCYSTSSFWYLDMLSSVITLCFILPQGWLVLSVEVIHFIS